MRRYSRALLILLTALFAAGVMYLFGIQFAAGDVYPEYSSLRTDPSGTKLLFDSLSVTPGLTASRNYLPLDVLDVNGAVLLLGLNPGEFGENEEGLRRLEKLAREGHRIIAAMALPTDYNEIMALALEKTWNVKLGADAGRKVHRLFFTEAKDWTVLDRIGPKLLAVERAFGKGSIVLFAESDDFTNVSTVSADRLEMVSLAIGGSTHVIFDEQHLGIAETGSFVGLARRFRLSGLALGLAILAALFVWRSASGFPPPRVVAGAPIAGRTSAAGLLTLLKRHIPPEELAGACWNEWLSANRQKVSKEHKEQAAGILRAQGTQPLEAIREVTNILGAHS
jgi:hypothetical protein